MPYVSVNYNEVVTFLEHLGEIVRHEREERGLSLPKAADEIGVPLTHLWAIEYDSDEADVVVIVKLLRWLESG